MKTNETFDWDSRDPLFDEVARYVAERQQVATSAISDKFGIGFNRANRILRQIVESGVLTSKPTSSMSTPVQH